MSTPGEFNTIRGRGSTRASRASIPRGPRAAGRGRNIDSRSPSPHASEISAQHLDTSPASATTFRGRAGARGGTAFNSRGAHSRGNLNAQRGRGGFAAAAQTANMAHSRNEEWRKTENADKPEYRKNIERKWHELQKEREKRIAQAIRENKMTAPGEQRSLDRAIPKYGECQEMDPEFDRIRRIFHNMVDRCEKIQLPSGKWVPCEERMVKKFERSSADKREDAPWELIGPSMAMKTLEYLFGDVLGGLGFTPDVHRFLWDRTRMIRTDLNMQTLYTIEDIKNVYTCFEMIARFHIFAMHFWADPAHAQEYPDYDRHQEFEQFNATINTLRNKYLDYRERYKPPHEAEIMSYMIILSLKYDKQSLETTSQKEWEAVVSQDKRIQLAWDIVSAARDPDRLLGPSGVGVGFPALATSNYVEFWRLVGQSKTPFLMACVAENHFHDLRRVALKMIRDAYNRPKVGAQEDLLMSKVGNWLGCDDEEQAIEFCEGHGLEVGERADGNASLDVRKWPSSDGYLPEPKKNVLKDPFSRTLVEKKRKGRRPLAIIKGLLFHEAQSQDLVEDVVMSSSEESAVGKTGDGFVPQDNPFAQTGLTAASNPFAASGPTAGTIPNPFANPTSNPFQKLSPAPDSHPFQRVSPAPESNPFQTAGPVPGSKPFQRTSPAPESNPFQKLDPAPTSNPFQRTSPVPDSNPFAKPSTSFPSAGSGSNPFARPALSDSQTSNSTAQPTNPFLPMTAASEYSEANSQSPGPSSLQIPGANYTRRGGDFGFSLGNGDMQVKVTPIHFPAPNTLAIGNFSLQAPSSDQQQSLTVPSPFGPPASDTPFAQQQQQQQTAQSPFGAPVSISQQMEKEQALAPSLGATVSAAQKPQEEQIIAASPFEVPASATQKTQEEAPLFVPEDKPKIQNITNSTTSPAKQALESDKSELGPQPVTSPASFFPKPSTTELPAARAEQSVKKSLFSPFPSTTPISTDAAPSTKPTTSVFQPQAVTQASPDATPQASTLPTIPSAASPRSTSQTTPSTSSQSPTKQSTVASSTVPPAATSSVFGTFQDSPKASGVHLSSASKASDSRKQRVSKASLTRGATKHAPLLKGPTREEQLTKLGKAYLFEKRVGLFDHFLQHEVGQIIKETMRKVGREREKKVVAESRRYLLMVNYVRRWKNFAWNRRLQQKGKKRRLEFRQSMQEFALSSRAHSQNPSASPAPHFDPFTSLTGPTSSAPMQPPPKPVSKKTHRASLPANSKLQGSQSIGTGKKPKRKSAAGTKTVVSEMSSTGEPQRDSIYKRSRAATTNLPGEKLVERERLMRQASRLISGRTDTTRSDYFKLKSLGIDPDTPVIPRTQARKRANEDEYDDYARKSRISPAKRLSGGHLSSATSVVPSTKLPTLSNHHLQESVSGTEAVANSVNDADDDEAFFAQIAAVKQQMTEDATWFREVREQSERTSMERERESEKQRKLREWKPSVNRTEARWQRDGLPSFLRAPWTPRESVSRSTSRVSEIQGDAEKSKNQTNGVPKATNQNDEDLMGEDGTERYAGEEDYIEDEEEEDNDAEGEYEEGEDDAEGDYEEEEDDAEGENEEDYEYEEDDGIDTQAFGATAPSSAFAGKGASADDAIEL